MGLSVADALTGHFGFWKGGPSISRFSNSFFRKQTYEATCIYFGRLCIVKKDMMTNSELEEFETNFDGLLTLDWFENKKSD